MRLWVKDEDRLPDPVPAKSDDRRAILVGLGLWFIALVATAVAASASLLGDERMPWLYVCITGIVLGVLGLVYTQRRRRRD